MDIEKRAKETTRVYSVVDFKAFDDEKREFSGIATTPATDRMGDIVDSDGAEYTLPISLLWQHDHNAPVGVVMTAKATKKGIEVKGSLAQVDSPAGLKARLEEAWQSIKHGLVRGLSIGFQPIEYNFMDSGGIHFTKWAWHELSLVTIPANAEANISTVKSMDQNQRAALGQSSGGDIDADKTPVGDTTKQLKTVSIVKPQEGKKMNIEEQIKGFKETRQVKSDLMNSLMEKAAEDGRTLDATESEQFEEAETEITAIDKQLERLEKMADMNKSKAEPVDDRSGMKPRFDVTPKVTEKLDKGIEFARYVMCLGSAKGDLSTASRIAQKRFPNSERINNVLKAAVDAGTTTDATWASPLVEYNQFAGDFVEFLRPQTIIGKFGNGSIPALRSIPFNVHIRGQTSGGSGYWVGQGAPKPLTSFDYDDTYLGFAKVANIAVLTDELLRFSNPSAERLVRDSLAGALVERLDTDFVDPTKAAVANVSPASITNGVTVISASGTGDADDVRTDVKAAMTQFISANITPSAGVWIMSATTALALSLMRNALGQKEFPDITMMGGTFEGLPVITSEYVPTDSDGGFVFLANASDIWLADDGQVVVDASREASLQMLSDPTNSSNPATPTTTVSMFQTNSLAIRAERWINWQKRRSAAVAVIDKVNWGAA